MGRSSVEVRGKGLQKRTGVPAEMCGQKLQNFAGSAEVRNADSQGVAGGSVCVHERVAVCGRSIG